MNYQQAYEFIQYSESFGKRLGLKTVKELLRRLDNPQNRRPVIHIAGTNGKGSVFAFLESGLKAGGYRVGRYISPTLFTYLERFQINGEYISEETFAALAEPVEEACRAMVQDGFLHPTVFEVETAIAFLYFAREMVDVVLLETGMGGSEDATNVVDHPLATVFCSISKDHMAFLGNSLTEIAEKKAGIMRKQVPVVIAPMVQECREVLLKKAADYECEVLEVVSPKAEYSIEGTRFVYEDREYTIPLLGTFQPDNAACAITVWNRLKEQFPMSEEAFAQGLARTVWKGRFEIMGKRPYVVRDGAHNADAIRRLKETLAVYFSGRDLHFVIGVFQDKEYSRMLTEIVPMAQSIYTVTPPNRERALPAEQLKQETERVLKECLGGEQIVVKAFEQVEEALSEAVRGSNPEDVVVLFGSLSLARFL
ncbi:MAG: bifunctional folylpolyglutamate synthase/dihydrofolate synthase [Lachnospiraceae bacterium]|nr:bifunctional folylpolyglutamate synthase/dihydrofolate synthase [Lachnospiraceae bacterium]